MPANLSTALLWVLSFLICIKGLFSCSPADLDPSLVQVDLSSQDGPYSPGDIHYQTCPQSASQQSVGWCPNPHDLTPNVTVNLGSFKAVHGIKFQNIHHNCDLYNQNFSQEPFLATFDLHYVIAGDPERNWAQYSEDMRALADTGPERMFEFAEPLVTESFRIIPKLYNIYPCFRFSVVACDATDLCPANWCLNGGRCSGKDLCTCSQGYYGDRCNNSVNNVEIENYDFLQITNNTLETPDATFDVVGNVTIEAYRKRDSHHHGHAVHCQGHNTYVQHRVSHSHHYHYHSHHHGRRNSHHGTCMSNLGHHSPGFTTSAHVNFGHHSSSHYHHIYSSGGHLPGHQGCSLHYHNNHLHFHVQSQSHHWSVSAPCNLHSNQWHHVQTSWHPHTGVSLHVNHHHVGSSSHAHVNSHSCTKTVPLRLCNTHQTQTQTHTSTHVTVNVNIQISGLNIIPVSQHQLTIAGIKGPYTAPPPTTSPPTTLSTTQPPPTTTTATTTTTRRPISATTTQSGPHRSVCYSCTSQSSLGSCQNKTHCQVGEVCTVFQDRSGYTSKCLDKQLCLDAKKVSGSSCWECCTSYLCNDHCQANVNITCADKPTCGTLMRTGFDVCKDPKMSVDICRKSCHKC